MGENTARFQGRDLVRARVRWLRLSPRTGRGAEYAAELRRRNSASDRRLLGAGHGCDRALAGEGAGFRDAGERADSPWLDRRSRFISHPTEAAHAVIP